MRAVSGTAGTDTTSPLWQPQPAKTTRREWHEERGSPMALSYRLVPSVCLYSSLPVLASLPSGDFLPLSSETSSMTAVAASSKGRNVFQVRLA